MNDRYYQLIIYWVIYFTTHSLFAGGFIKARAGYYLGPYYKYYRIIYVILFSVSLIIPAVWLIRGNQELIFPKNIVSSFWGITLDVTGLMIIKQSFKVYRLGEFIGTDYLKSGSGGKDLLRTSGILSIIRHPIYAGTILLALGMFLILPSVSVLISCLCIIIYILIGIRMEEKKLMVYFGDSYAEYRNKVPMLVPGLRRLRIIKK